MTVLPDRTDAIEIRYNPEMYDDDEYEDDYTIDCPSCGASIYEDAQQCPACGDYIVSKRKSAMQSVFGNSVWYWPAVIIVILLVLAIAGFLGPAMNLILP